MIYKKDTKTPAKEIKRAEEIRRNILIQKNKTMEDLKFYTEEEALDLALGQKGTPERDQYEENMHSFLVGDAGKKNEDADVFRCKPFDF